MWLGVCTRLPGKAAARRSRIASSCLQLPHAHVRHEYAGLKPRPSASSSRVPPGRPSRFLAGSREQDADHAVHWLDPRGEYRGNRDQCGGYRAWRHPGAFVPHRELDQHRLALNCAHFLGFCGATTAGKGSPPPANEHLPSGATAVPRAGNQWRGDRRCDPGPQDRSCRAEECFHAFIFDGRPSCLRRLTRGHVPVPPTLPHPPPQECTAARRDRWPRTRLPRRRPGRACRGRRSWPCG